MICIHNLFARLQFVAFRWLSDPVRSFRGPAVALLVLSVGGAPVGSAPGTAEAPAKPVAPTARVPGDAAGSRKSGEPGSRGSGESASPQSSLTVLLDQLQKHPRLRAAELEYRARQRTARSAGRVYPDPEIMVGAMDGRMRRTTSFPDVMLEDATSSGTEVRVIQPLPFPGRLSAEARSRNRAAEVALRRLALERVAIESDFLSLVSEALAARRIRDLARVYASRARTLSLAARTRYQTGKGALSDVAGAQVRRDLFRDRATEAQGVLEARVATLAYYFPSSEREKALHFLENPALLADFPAAVARLRALVSRLEAKPSGLSPDVALARAEAEMRDEEHRVSRFGYLPDFSIFAGIRREDANSRYYEINSTRERSVSFGLSIRVPLWSALANTDRVGAAKLEARSAEEKTREAELRVRSALLSAAAEERILTERIRLYTQELIPRAATARESTRISYETGRTDFSTLVNAWDTLYMLEVEVVRLRAEQERRLFLRARLLGVRAPVSPGNEAGGSG